MADQKYRVEDVLPHRQPMILIDEIVQSGDEEEHLPTPKS